MSQILFKAPTVLSRHYQIRSLSTQLGKLTSHPTSIRPSQDEIKHSRLSHQSLEVAMRSLHRDGIVVVENVIPHDYLNRLNKKMIEDAYSLRSKNGDCPFNYNPGNIQQDAPPVREYFEPSIFMNPIATQITSSALGPRPKWTFCSGNSAMPPTAENPPMSQPVHSDADFAHPTHPFAYVINVPLITMTPENGSTEVWLGTHIDTGLHVQEGLHGERASGRVKLDELQKRRLDRPPCQPVVPKGSLVVRDIRLWHAGVGNQTEDPRVMLAMIHFAPWYRNPMKLEFADDLKPVIEGQTDLEIPVNWVTKSEALSRYLNRGFGNAYDFNQQP
ncbi:hypothetical protein N7491_010338 [Penicillium cf. griseofulvum]|uniref:Phytanoyl-CoA dioxygenase n=1 Tax=Penicillium cf. griseofulvum TaxID=2972120 RepID=A0A9W9T5Z1_9EURO|nr:hypothetical protein N7472_000670 [Penicillium cf. griseofulvum]KAJ5421893.1 hypothetical protein N7491_010338 [Penicillium cf. griseofulvum]KAJ5428084.1 hypothetical protein N7445_009538 [Penicillium cf. griseofulvum]